MKKFIFAKFSLVGLTFALALACVSSAFAAATIVVINNDGANEGFNDPTPAVPVGGNPETTLGAQRLFAFRFAADIWGAELDSNEIIYVVAAFNPLAPNVLGSAGAWDVFSDFPAVGLYPGPEFAQTWYSSALADKRAGIDQDNTAPDINAQFSSNFNFYLGVDNNHGPLNDLVAVLLHELAHGLGFQNFVNEATGRNLGNFFDGPRFYPVQTDVYSHHTLDITNNLLWSDMTDAQRQASAVRFGSVVWDGASVTAALPGVLSLGSPEVEVLSPASVARQYQFGAAGFGPPFSSPGVTATVVAAVDPADAAGPATTDGCTAFTNAADIAGKIALVERGTCGFIVKVKNAQNAGALAVFIYNNAANAAAAAPGLGGVDPTITIPSVGFSRADGLAILNAGSPVTASLGLDPNVFAGADAAGRARLYAITPVALGSSISHYDNVARRNLLMEPAINPDLTHSVKPPEDLTLNLMRDIGWFPDADLDGVANDEDCEPNSNMGQTVAINGCDSGVANTLFNNGCSFSDRIAQIAAGAKNHGKFVSGVTQLLNELKKNGTITTAQRNALHKCASKKP